MKVAYDLTTLPQTLEGLHEFLAKAEVAEDPRLVEPIAALIATRTQQLSAGGRMTQSDEPDLRFLALREEANGNLAAAARWKALWLDARSRSNA